MKKYSYNKIYRGQQIMISFCAKTNKEASEKTGLSLFYIRKWFYIDNIEEPFEGMLAHFDGGMLWRERKDLIRVDMPLDRMHAIIDSYKDESYQQFKKDMGIE